MSLQTLYVNLSACLSVCPVVCSSVCLFVCLPVCGSACVPVCLSFQVEASLLKISVCISDCQSGHFLCLFICLSVCMSLSLSLSCLLRAPVRLPEPNRSYFRAKDLVCRVLRRSRGCNPSRPRGRSHPLKAPLGSDKANRIYSYPDIPQPSAQVIIHSLTQATPGPRYSP